MYYNRGLDFAEILPIFFFVLIGVCAVVWGIVFFIKKSDDKKELITRYAKVIEKVGQQGSVGWYTIEFDNGERKQLRSFNANTILLSPGDTGIIKYRGQTIQSFERNKK